MLPCGESVPDLLFGHAVHVSVHLGVLKQLIGIDQFLKSRTVHKVVVDTLHLSRTRGPRCGGYDEVERVLELRHALQDGVFADAGRSRHNDHHRAPATRPLMSADVLRHVVIPDSVSRSRQKVG